MLQKVPHARMTYLCSIAVEGWVLIICLYSLRIEVHSCSPVMLRKRFIALLLQGSGIRCRRHATNVDGARKLLVDHGTKQVRKDRSQVLSKDQRTWVVDILASRVLRRLQSMWWWTNQKTPTRKWKRSHRFMPAVLFSLGFSQHSPNITNHVYQLRRLQSDSLSPCVHGLLSCANSATVHPRWLSELRSLPGPHQSPGQRSRMHVAGLRRADHAGGSGAELGGEMAAVGWVCGRGLCRKGCGHGEWAFVPVVSAILLGWTELCIGATAGETREGHDLTGIGAIVTR